MPSLPTRLLAAAALLLASPALGAEPKVESDVDKAIYLIGVGFSRTLQPLMLSEDELALIARGLREGYAGESMKLDEARYGAVLKMLQEERIRKALAEEAPASAAYVETEAKRPGAVRLDSGVIYTEMVTGKGGDVGLTSEVEVHYTGTLRDGSIFDSTVERGKPVKFVIGKVIPCWNEAIPRMKTGGKARIVCPASTAYGEAGVPGAIPPGAALTFDVELLSVN